MGAEEGLVREVREVRAVVDRARRWATAGLFAPYSILWGLVLLGGGVAELTGSQEVRRVAWPILVGLGAVASIVVGWVLGPQVRVRDPLWWRHPLHWALVTLVALGLPHLAGLDWSGEGSLLPHLVFALGYVLYGLWWFPVAALAGTAAGVAVLLGHFLAPAHLRPIGALAWAVALLASGLLTGTRWGWR
ncbi:MAG: hypothetical protein QN193_07030 [Armatimonadota bacterium]|nr:hypothetical protein [Armatimonadota bacterium]MDR7443510.1 hypothetical protein [Armatimonadota bacterium]MDR7570343.1 hypothetical protein [Armatimonadota bacterium]MDR7615009.1 hypothetical protein [Armatimonadota bacterium]